MSRIYEIFQRLSDHIPIPETELKYTNPYTLLIAVVLSAQSTDKGVNKATDHLFKIVSTPQDMVYLGLDKLKEHIKTIGLFNTKAKNIMALSQKLIDEYNSIVPSTREELMRLPGVGRKTANVVLNVVFNQPTIPVDTHVARVSNRLDLTTAIHPDKIEAELEQIIPSIFLKSAHHLLILHGRYTCIARKPKCSNCILNDLCKYNLPHTTT
ncbi:MAG: endonuclease III [Candidatus Paracaedibacteraceae bacterium]|nr:endonuclease III [Candidatus Paracaedibacteraceae bacterium]